MCPDTEEKKDARARGKHPVMNIVLWVLLALDFVFSVIAPFLVPSDQAVLCASMFFTFDMLLGLVFVFCYFKIKQAIGMLVVVFLVATGFENLSILTGFPFGNFYHTLPGPYIGLAPAVAGFCYVAFAMIGWLFAMLVVPDYLFSSRGGTAAIRIVLAGLVGGALESMFDPMGHAYFHYWVYPKGGEFFGAPFANVFGWMLTIAVSLAVFYLIFLRYDDGVREGRERTYDLHLLVLLAITIPAEFVCLAVGGGQNLVDDAGVTWSSSAMFGTLADISLMLIPILVVIGYVAHRRHLKMNG
ncbi:MAG: carotenoid biosynthesis protein [Coriobacteriales bacterium]|jgi:uncharacterized membrane protein